MLVFVGQQFACIKLIGQANFTFAIDFKTRLTELQRKGSTELALPSTTLFG